MGGRYPKARRLARKDGALQVKGGGVKVLGTLIKSVFLYSLAVQGWR